MRRDVILRGELAVAAGAERLVLDVAGPREVIRALCVQRPVVRHVLVSADWEVLLDGRPANELGILADSTRWQTIEILPALSGAASGKRGPLKILAGIFLVGAALFLGPGIAGAAGIFNIGSKAAMIIGGLGAATALQGVSLLIAPLPKMDYQAPEDADKRQSALFSGMTNLQGSGHPIPLVYGRMRAGSVQVSESIQTIDDSLFPLGAPVEYRSRARMRLVDVVSEGEIKGLLTGDGVSVLFGDTRVVEAQGTVNFENVVIDEVVGAPGDPATISNVERILPVQTETTNADGTVGGGQTGSVARTIDDPNVDAIRVTAYVQSLYGSTTPTAGALGYRIEINSGGGSFEVASIRGTVVESDSFSSLADTSTSTVVTGFAIGVEIEYASDPGPIAYGTLRWVRLADYPGGPWAERVIEGVYEYSSVIRYFTAEVNDLAIDQWVVELVPLTPSTYSSVVSGSSVEYYGAIELLNGVVLGERYEKDHTIGNLVSLYGPAPWTVRLVKLTQDATNPATALNIMGFARYAEVIEREFTYDDVARVSVTFDAESTGGAVPERLYEVDGILLELPSNLDPVTRMYTGTWDGTFSGTRQWYDNPAWILWDLLRSSRYGLGLAESEIDKWSVFDAAVWCDELVDDGQGGTEPRFTFNHTFSVREDALRLIQSVASAMQAQLWVGSGKVFVTQDRPRPVAKIFTNANVIGGAFDYSSVGILARTNHAKVSWRNPAQGWESDTESVDRPYAQDRFGRNEQDVLAVGCTARGQAIRRGRLDVLTAELEGGSVRFRVGPENALMEPGQVLEIRDKNRLRARRGGRIKSFTTVTVDQVELDQSLPSSVHTTGTLRVVLDDGSLHSTTVTAAGGGGGGGGDPVDFELDTPLPGGRTILRGAPWIITDAAGHFFRALAVRPINAVETEIEALAHDPEKQDRIEDFADIGAPITLPATPTLADPVISGALVATYNAAADMWSVSLTWTADPLAVWALVQITAGGGAVDVERITRDTSPTFEVGDAATVGGTLCTVVVRSLTADGAAASGTDSIAAVLT